MADDTSSPQRSSPQRSSPHRPDHSSCIDALETELARTVSLAQRTPAALEIATCPGWQSGDLWKHLGIVHRWATEMVRTRATEPVDRRSLDMGIPDDGDWATWLAAGGTALVAALLTTTAEEPVWVWGDDPHMRWWARRQLHETIIHNADAALALGEPVQVGDALAADCIDELLENVASRLALRGATPPDGARSVHLHATDSPGEWLVRIGDGTVSHTHEHAKGDVAARGPVGELMLVMHRRRTPEEAGIETFGDSDALDVLLDLASLG